MSCDLYRQYELGQLDAQVFEQHRLHCRECQQQRRADEQLLLLTKQLEQPSATPLLWVKIENALRAEQQRVKRKHVLFPSSKKMAAWAIAASVILAVGTGTWLKLKLETQTQTRVLNASALHRVEQKEKEYEDAIAELERTTAPQLAQLNVELMLLYRDRLETIEAQIARCREALAENPANAHIRRYLLMALQDKKEALRELARRHEG